MKKNAKKIAFLKIFWGSTGFWVFGNKVGLPSFSFMIKKVFFATHFILSTMVSPNKSLTEVLFYSKSPSYFTNNCVFVCSLGSNTWFNFRDVLVVFWGWMTKSLVSIFSIFLKNSCNQYTNLSFQFL